MAQFPKFFTKHCWNSQSGDKFPKLVSVSGNPGRYWHVPTPPETLFLHPIR